MIYGLFLAIFIENSTDRFIVLFQHEYLYSIASRRKECVHIIMSAMKNKLNLLF